MTFTLRKASDMASDATMWFDVKFDGPCTVRDLIEELCAEDDVWGAVYVVTGEHTYENIKMSEFRHGHLVLDTLNPTSNGIAKNDCWDRRITSAVAHGGWSMYDFYLRLGQEVVK